MPDPKAVFGPYFNGEKQVYADPLVVYRRLVRACQGEPNRYLRDARSDDREKRFQAKEVLVPAARYALDLVPFDRDTGAGSTEDVTLTALRQFTTWVKKNATSTPTSVTCSRPTDPPASDGLWPPLEDCRRPPTSSGSACG